MTMLFCNNLLAQKTIVQKKSPDASMVNAGKKSVGRYEIYVFPKNLIKLDTFTGKTYYSSFQQNGVKLWSLAKVSGDGLPDESSSISSKYRIYEQQPNYREQYPTYIYYLLNTETGQTWVSKTASDSYLLWESFSGN